MGLGIFDYEDDAPPAFFSGRFAKGSTQQRPKTSMTRNEEHMIAKAKVGYEAAVDPIEKLRYMCQSRGFSGYLSLGSMFRRMDEDESGSLDFEEFSTGMRNSGLDMDNTSLRQLFDCFDKEGSGTIKITEFRLTIRPEMKPVRKRLVMEAFRKLDPIGLGVVSYEDLKNASNVKNYPTFLSGDETESEILERFLKNFEDGIYEGKVTIEEFKDYYAGVSASIDSDTYFDLMMRNFWKF